MDNCQICNSECERTFCDDCAKMVQSGIKDLQSELTRLTAENAELKRKLGVADKGLAHYADESTWEHHSSGVDGADKRQYKAVCYNGTPTGDGWVVAREALAEIENAGPSQGK